MFSIRVILLVVLIALSAGCQTTSQTISEEQGRLIQLVQIAEESYQLGLLTDAEAKYRRIISSYPDYHESWLKLGNIYTRTDQLEAAVMAYQNCLALKNEEMRCWNNLALARVKQALATLREGRSNMPENSMEAASINALYNKVIRVLSTNKQPDVDKSISP